MIRRAKDGGAFITLGALQVFESLTPLDALDLLGAWVLKDGRTIRPELRASWDNIRDLCKAGSLNEMYFRAPWLSALRYVENPEERAAIALEIMRYALKGKRIKDHGLNVSVLLDVITHDIDKEHRKQGRKRK